MMVLLTTMPMMMIIKKIILRMTSTIMVMTMMPILMIRWKDWCILWIRTQGHGLFPWLAAFGLPYSYGWQWWGACRWSWWQQSWWRWQWGCWFLHIWWPFITRIWEVFQFRLLSSNYAQGDVLREKLLSLSKLRPRYDASTTPNAVPSGNVIEVIVYSQVTQPFHLIYFCA